jgi:hypothetical protein
MKKVLTLIIALVGSATMSLAQDIITLRSGEEIKALVQEVGATEVKYKKFENAAGPTYAFWKAGVFMIKYANGERVVFSDTATTPANTMREAGQITPPASLKNEKLRVALMDITPTGSYNSAAAYITSEMTTALVQMNKYRVVERARIQEILNEQGFQDEQAASAQAVNIGKLLGVHKIITGEHKSGSLDGLNLRFIDVETGDIEAAVNVNDGIYKKNGKFLRCMTRQEFVEKALNELFKRLE